MKLKIPPPEMCLSITTRGMRLWYLVHKYSVIRQLLMSAVDEPFFCQQGKKVK